MKYVMWYESNPEGLEKARANFPAHRARLDEFHGRGTLLMAGPLVDPAGIPSGGAVGVFTSREAAEEFIEGDPFIVNGVVSTWSVLAWAEVLA